MAVIPLQEPKPRVPPETFSLWALGFRPFYVLAAGFAALALPVWLLMWSGSLPAQPAMPSFLWHGHEMVFGFACAVIVGFLFTAGQTWTGRPTPKGALLAGFAALWVAARIAAWWLPPAMAAVLDVGFLAAAAGVMASLIWRVRQRRNYFVPVLLLALAACNAAVYASVLGLVVLDPMQALRVAVALITVLETVIAGRIVPSFTSNATGVKTRRLPWLDRAAIIFTAMALLSWAAGAPALLQSSAAVIAGLLQLVRVALWRPEASLRNPLLWVLHISHGWIVVALLLQPAMAHGLVPMSTWMHILTVGAMGGLIMAMITRTALGHTGRMLKAGGVETAAYLLVLLALAARVLPGLAWPSLYAEGMWLSGLAWSAAFALYLFRYLPYLLRARADGLPG